MKTILTTQTPPKFLRHPRSLWIIESSGKRKLEKGYYLRVGQYKDLIETGKDPLNCKSDHITPSHCPQGKIQNPYEGP